MNACSNRVGRSRSPGLHVKKPVSSAGLAARGRGFALWIVLTAATALGGCVTDHAAVVTSGGAAPVPGLAGAWSYRQDDGTTNWLLIARTGFDTYQVTRRSGRGHDEIYEGVYLLPIGDPRRHAYVASVPRPGDVTLKSRVLFVVKVRRQSLEIPMHSSGHVGQVGAALGVPLTAGAGIAATASKDAALELMSKLSAEDFSDGWLYARQGWFKQRAGVDISLESARALLAAGKTAEAAHAYDYMARRGSAHAQLALGRLAASGTVRDAGFATTEAFARWSLLDAHRSGDQQAARVLAEHLRSQGAKDEPLFRTPLYWLAVAQVQAGGSDRALLQKMREAARIECLARSPEARQRQSESDCIDIGIGIEAMRAQLSFDLEETQDSIASTVLELKSLRAAQQTR